MQAQSPMSDTRITGLSLKVAFHIALAALLVIWCFIIVKPFLWVRTTTPKACGPNTTGYEPK